MHRSTFSGSARAFLVGIMSLAASSAVSAQSAPSAASPAPAQARALTLPAPTADLATVQPQAATNDVVPATAAPATQSDMMHVRPAGLSTRNHRTNSELPLPAPRQENSGTRTNTALMIVGAAAIVLGAAVGDEAGTVLIIGGAGIGLYGLYRLLN